MTTGGAHYFFIKKLYSDRLQVVATCCNRRVNIAPSHVTFSRECTHSHFNVVRDIGSRWLSASLHPCFMRSVCSDLSSTLHFALFTVSLIFLFILLIFIFIFHVGRFGEVPCALPRMRSLALWPTTPLSQVMSPTSSTTSTSQRPLKSSSRCPPATAGPRTCMTGKAVTTPSEERSLHHCSLRSEKIQRAVNKLITLLKKVCCQVSRCLSFMLEQRDLFPISLDHSLKRSEKIHVATQKMTVHPGILRRERVPD